MNFFKLLFSSPAGKKVLMAVSGAVWVGFLPVHLLGNLQFFFGPDAMNQYAHTLQSMGALKWLARFIFVSSFFLHVYTAVILKIQNSSARPIGYSKHKTIRATAASRTMILSGFAILSFIIYHLLHYTLGVAHSEFYGRLDSSGRHDVYSMMLGSFQNPLISVAYIAAVTLITMHLSHAFSSMFQTLGLNGRRTESLWKNTALLFSILIFTGYVSIPLSVILGFIR